MGGYGVQNTLEDDLQQIRDGYVQSLHSAIFPVAQQPAPQKEIDPHAYRDMLTKSHYMAQKQFDLGKYYHELAFSRAITHEDTQTHAIRYG